jgi:hypothetical protein
VGRRSICLIGVFVVVATRAQSMAFECEECVFVAMFGVGMGRDLT